MAVPVLFNCTRGVPTVVILLSERTFEYMHACKVQHKAFTLFLSFDAISFHLEVSNEAVRFLTALQAPYLLQES